MRNAVHVFSVSVMVLLAAGMAFAQTSEPSLGDVNGDGVINVLDVQAAVCQALLIAAPTAQADLDGSSQVDIADIQNLINTALGKGGLVQRIKGELNAAVDALQAGIQLMAVSPDGDQEVVSVDPSTGKFTITLPTKKQWSFVFVTKEDDNGGQTAATVDFPVGTDTSTLLPLPDLSQCDVLDLGKLVFAGTIKAPKDVRELLASINKGDILTDADGNGIPDFLDTMLNLIARLPMIGCGPSGPAAGSAKSIESWHPGTGNGSLQVTIEPAEAVTAGAHWRVDGGERRDSGATVSGLCEGPHMVTFSKQIPGWTAPEPTQVAITDGNTVTLTVTYVAKASEGEGEGEGEGGNCLVDLIKPCIKDHLAEITNVSLVDADGNGIPDFAEPFLQCLKDALKTWLQQNQNPIPVDFFMQLADRLIPQWLLQIDHQDTVDTGGDGIPDRLRDLLGKPGLPPSIDANGDGIPDVLEGHHHHGGEGEGESACEGEGETI